MWPANIQPQEISSTVIPLFLSQTPHFSKLLKPYDKIYFVKELDKIIFVICHLKELIDRETIKLNVIENNLSTIKCI